MGAGYPYKGSVYRSTENPDDQVGGANITGVLVYRDVQMNIHEMQPSELLLQQGFETRRMARAMLQPSSLVIYEGDEIVITHPLHSPFYSARYAVFRVRRSSIALGDSRSFIEVTLRKWDFARTDL